MSIGAVGGVGLFAISCWICRPLDFRGGLNGALPWLGETPGQRSYRDVIDQPLTWLDESLARQLRAARIIAISAVVTGTVGATGDVSLMHAMRPSSGLGPLAELIPYACVGAAGGFAMGLALLPMSLTGVIAITAGAFMISGMATNLLYGEFRGLSLLLLLLIHIPVAVVVMLVTRYFGGWLIERILPRPIRSHLLGRAEPQPVVSASLHMCENCGYDLTGLSERVCGACQIAGLRCPECGKTQPEGTRHARLMRKIYRCHAALRALTWLAALALLILVISGAFALGVNAPALKWENGPVGFVLMASLVLIFPLRMLVLHRKLGWALAAFLPLVALVAGDATWHRRVSWEALALPVAMLTGVSLLAHRFWRMWLWLMYRDDGSRVWDWQRRSALTHAPAEAVIERESWALGGEVPISNTVLVQCADCGVIHASTGTIALPVSRTRICFESIITRARLWSLAMLAGSALACVCIVAFILLIGAASADRGLRYDRGLLTSLSYLAIPSAVCGTLLRLIAARRRLIPDGMAFVFVCLGLWMLWTHLLMSYQGHEVFVLLGIVAAIGAWAGALVALPLLRLTMTILIGRTQARELLQWAGVRSYI